MAFNPSKEVAIARDAAVKLGADRCILIYTTADGKFNYSSFGQTKQLCDNARKMADVGYEAISNAERIGSQSGSLDIFLNLKST